MTADSAALDTMRKIPIFRNLNATECHQLAEIAKVVAYEPGQIVLRQGERDQNLSIVMEGECEVYKEKNPGHPQSEEVVLAALGPHSHFGEMSFFHAAPHSASVRAKTPLKLLRIARSEYDELIQDGVVGAYKLAYNAVEAMAQRLRRMDEWVAELLDDQSPAAPPAGDHADVDLHEWSFFREKLFDKWNL